MVSGPPSCAGGPELFNLVYEAMSKPRSILAASFRRQSIVHMERRVLKAPDTRMAAHRRAKEREVLQEVNVVQEAVGKALS